MSTWATVGFLAVLLLIGIGWALFVRELIEHPLWAPRQDDDDPREETS